MSENTKKPHHRTLLMTDDIACLSWSGWEGGGNFAREAKNKQREREREREN